MSSDTWEIKITIAYRDRGVMIDTFNQFVEQIRKNNFALGGGGNSAASYNISGPREKPLTDIEIMELRRMIDAYQ